MVYLTSNSRDSYTFQLRSVIFFLMVPFTDRWMVLPWASTLACFSLIFFLSFHERSWLNNCPPEFTPSYYRRYVDDCFLWFRSPNHIPLFFDFLNHQYFNIKFTSEIESNSTLLFLDVKITLSNRSFSTSVYHKPTFIGLFTNFDSFFPLSYRRSLILSLLHRFLTFALIKKSFIRNLTHSKKFLKVMVFPLTFLRSVFA